MGTTNWRRPPRLPVLSCYLLLIIVCSWLALYLFGALRTANPWYRVGVVTPVRSSRRLFVERPLVLLTLSYHAAPIYDLMDQLQPLGVQFIERGINAYACQYFNTCRRHDPLKVNRWACCQFLSCLVPCLCLQWWHQAYGLVGG